MTQNAQVVFDHFPELNDTQKDQIVQLESLYKDWNAKINVISRKDIEELYIRHVLHSLAIAKYFSFPAGSKVLDIGTGGGFPGVPLAILFPECSFYLADSIGKKIKVVNEVASALGLANVEAEHVRVEKIKRKFDYVVSRAVARTQVLYNWTHRLIKPNDHPTLASGYLLLKGGDLDEELKEFGRSHSLTNLSEYFNEEFFETKKLVYIPV
ncbi:16S rRNA (guanine(527)-N(7))-methyltransferase RsmG [Marinoscillum furvescens]|uniref:Ribosomal RNA small subunit methyltransferase G n=1 Tax=Marinoscillum furvescens DSM 4134 TaxID=1122208 RepID=A0A3D9KZH7_MARFU|nr:16S rRNA (guanine(527)-N(7))-methyltransferase RsmG [Marinoscillum furvescens]RED93368.1 16S rRNA m(7)G-527 methyltransferase [Marinoscillum furvescens DSM 4134]